MTWIETIAYENADAKLKPLYDRVKGPDNNIEAAPLDNRQKIAMEYARELTHDPGGIREGIIKRLRAAGYSDGEILEINQVSAYFSYANRTVLGLGCSTEGDILGLSPNKNDDPDDWRHS
jgi:uncharacterized protein YciW